MRKHERLICRMLKRDGFTVDTVERDRRHLRLVVSRNGWHGAFTTPHTPSDNQRGLINLRADVRRAYRENRDDTHTD